jgi:hypothetical protein
METNQPENELKLVKILAASFLVAGVPNTFAQTSHEKSAYAVDECKSGCFVAQAGAKFYQGAVSQSYRVCAMNVHDSAISVDGMVVKVPGMSFGVRHCVDVNGRELSATDSNVAVGRLPN